MAMIILLFNKGISGVCIVSGIELNQTWLCHHEAYNLMWEVILLAGNFNVVCYKCYVRRCTVFSGTHGIISSLVFRTLLVSLGKCYLCRDLKGKQELNRQGIIICLDLEREWRKGKW